MATAGNQDFSKRFFFDTFFDTSKTQKKMINDIEEYAKKEGAKVTTHTGNNFVIKLVLWSGTKTFWMQSCTTKKQFRNNRLHQTLKLDQNLLEERHSTTLATLRKDGKLQNLVNLFEIHRKQINFALEYYICHAGPKDLNNLDLAQLATNASEDLCFEYGVSPLHARIKFLEYLLHMSYRLDLPEESRKKGSRLDAEKRKIVETKKRDIQEKLRSKLGLLVDVPKQGFGSINDGNTARTFLENPELCAEILGIKVEIVERFATILTAINTSQQVDADKFGQYALATAEKLENQYSFWTMSNTVHKVLLHGKDLIQYNALPLGFTILTTMEKRKANGLQDNDVGFPNTPVRRYLYRQKIEKETSDLIPSAGWTDPSGQQRDQPQQQQMQMQPLQQQMQMQPQQQQMQMQPQHQQQIQMQPQLQQMQMQPQQQRIQMQPQQQMVQGQQNVQMHQNLPQQQTLPAQQNIQQQDSENRIKKRATVKNGMDTIMNQQKRQIRSFDPEASIMKQRENENQWQFAKKQAQQQNAYQQQGIQSELNQAPDSSYSEELHHSNNLNKLTPTQRFLQGQMPLNPQQMTPYSQISNPHVYHHAQHLNPKPKISPPLKNGMQATKCQVLNNAYNQNYHGHNHQYQPLSGEQAEVQPVSSKEADYENNPHLMGENPGHNYQPLYAGSNQQRNLFQQPSYYMNQPSGGQHYQQSFQGQAQMQA